MKHRIGIALLVLVGLVALGADLLASDLPLYIELDGHRYVLPCITHPAALVGEDQQSLSRARILRTPIPYGPLAQRPGGTLDPLAAPSAKHLLGTDDRGRDVAARLVHGARVAALVGPLAVLVYLVIGVVIGSLCAASSLLDVVLVRLIEAGLSIPPLLLLLAVRGFSGAGSAVGVAVVIALAEWPIAARLVRAEAIRIAKSEHVVAARAVGNGRIRIALVHVLPLAWGPALVLASFGLGQAVLFESALGFLGYGVAPPTASWGELLAQASVHPRAWLIAPPTLAIALVVIAARLSARTSPVDE